MGVQCKLFLSEIQNSRSETRHMGRSSANRAPLSVQRGKERQRRGLTLCVCARGTGSAIATQDSKPGEMLLPLRQNGQ
jgi:hypothetical protein